MLRINNHLKMFLFLKLVATAERDKNHWGQKIVAWNENAPKAKKDLGYRFCEASLNIALLELKLIENVMTDQYFMSPEQESVRMGTLVSLFNNDEKWREEACYFLIAPVCSCKKIIVDGVFVNVVTPESELGARLMGKAIQDVILLPASKRQGMQKYTISYIG